MTPSRKEERKLERKAKRKLEKQRNQGIQSSEGSVGRPQAVEGDQGSPATGEKSKSGVWFVLIAFVLLATWMSFRDSEKSESGRTGETPPIPSPPLTEMTGPVKTRIEEARGRLETNLGSTQAWGNLGELYDAHHLFDDAIVCYREAERLATEPLDRFRWSYLLGTASNIAGGDDEETESALKRAIRLEPDYPPGHLRLGDALVRMGRNAEAKGSFEKALALDPEFAMAQRNLGQLLLAEDDVEGALRHLEEALRIDPSDSVVHSSLARAYRSQGKEDEARKAAQSATSLQPVFGVPDPIRFAVEERAVDPLSLESRIDRLLAEKDIDGAMQTMDLLEESFPDDGKVLQKIGLRRFAAGRKEAAKKTLERALEQNDHLHEAQLQLAYIYDEEKEFDKALVHYEHVASEDASNLTLQKRIGFLYLGKNDLAKGVEYLLRAAEGGLSEPDLHHNLGAALDRLERTEEAVFHFRKVLESEPDNAGTHYNLAIALERLGNVQRALEHYDRAAALAPKLPAAERAAELRANQ